MNGQQTCDLCGLDVGLKPFFLHHGEKQWQFCCEGCRGIYQMLHDIEETLPEKGDNPPEH